MASPAKTPTPSPSLRIPTGPRAERSPQKEPSPLQASAATFTPSTPLPHQFHARQDSFMGISDFFETEKTDGVKEDMDVHARTLRHRYERTRAKMVTPCAKCQNQGHKMVECSLVGEYERGKILGDWEEVKEFAGEEEDEMGEQEKKAGDENIHPDRAAVLEIEETIKEALKMSKAELSGKIAQNLKSWFGEDLWRAPCLRCEILWTQWSPEVAWPFWQVEVPFTSRVGMKPPAHRLVDCEWVHRGARVLLKEERGEPVGGKDKNRDGW